MESWQTALLVLNAVLVAGALTVILLLRSTLAKAQALIARNNQELERALHELTDAAGRFSRATATAQDRGPPPAKEPTASEDLGGVLSALSERVRGAAVLGAAVAPVITAAVRALRARAPVTDELGSKERHGAHAAHAQRRSALTEGQAGEHMREDDGTRGSGMLRMVLAFAGGAAAGVIAGMLLAPRTGAENRASLREMAERAKGHAAKLPTVIEEARVAVKEALGSRAVPPDGHGAA